MSSFIIPGHGRCAWDGFSNHTINGKNTLTFPSLRMTSPALSERLSYFVQVRGQICNSGEGAQRCTLPSLQAFYKGLAESRLSVAPAETVVLYGRVDGVS